MRLIANKHLNHGKNSEQLGTRWKRLSTRKTQVSKKKYKLDPKKLSEFFNKKAERLVGKRKADNTTLPSYISSLKDKSNSSKLRLVTPTKVSKCIKTLRNDCSTGLR